MDIVDARSAREYVNAWAEVSPRRRARKFQLAAEAQGSNAGMDFLYGRKSLERKSRAAQRVLQLAERAALCEVLGWSPQCVATTSELWQEVGKVA
jgi:hypothetical protein